MTDASRDDRPTEVLFPAASDEPRRRRGGAARAWVTVLAILVAIGALLVIADVVTRSIAERQVAAQLQANLPDGVDGDIDVSIGGFSVLAQYLSGSMEHIELSAPELVVDGVPIAVDVDLHGVPPALDGPVARVEASIEADGAAIDRVMTLAGIEGGVTLGDGAVAYERSVEVLGIPVRVVVTATPVAAGETVVLEAVGAELAAGGATVDVSGLVDRVVGDDPLTVCVAEYLPDGVEITGITVTDDHARVDLDAAGLSLDEASLATTGSCG